MSPSFRTKSPERPQPLADLDAGIIWLGVVGTGFEFELRVMVADFSFRVEKIRA